MYDRHQAPELCRRKRTRLRRVQATINVRVRYVGAHVHYDVILLPGTILSPTSTVKCRRTACAYDRRLCRDKSQRREGVPATYRRNTANTSGRAIAKIEGPVQEELQCNGANPNKVDGDQWVFMNRHLFTASVPTADRVETSSYNKLQHRGTGPYEKLEIPPNTTVIKRRHPQHIINSLSQPCPQSNAGGCEIREDAKSVKDEPKKQEAAAENNRLDDREKKCRISTSLNV